MSSHRARRTPILQRRCAPKRYFAFEPLSLESVLGTQPHADRTLRVCAIVVPEVEVSLVTEHDARPVVLQPLWPSAKEMWRRRVASVYACCSCCTQPNRPTSSSRWRTLPARHPQRDSVLAAVRLPCDVAAWPPHAVQRDNGGTLDGRQLVGAARHAAEQRCRGRRRGGGEGGSGGRDSSRCAAWWQALHRLPCLESTGFHVLQAGQRNGADRPRPGQIRAASEQEQQRVREDGTASMRCVRLETGCATDRGWHGETHICRQRSRQNAHELGEHSAACGSSAYMCLR